MKMTAGNQNIGVNEMNKVIDVLYVTHGSQVGSQTQFNHDTHKWTVWTKQGLERSYNDVVAFTRFMTRGY